MTLDDPAMTCDGPLLTARAPLAPQAPAKAAIQRARTDVAMAEAALESAQAELAAAIDRHDAAVTSAIAARDAHFQQQVRGQRPTGALHLGRPLASDECAATPGGPTQVCVEKLKLEALASRREARAQLMRSRAEAAEAAEAAG